MLVHVKLRAVSYLLLRIIIKELEVVTRQEKPRELEAS
jgi:hypothetical protein